MTLLNVTLLTLLLVFPRLLLAQIFHGQIGDNRTFKPLPYATLGIKGKPISGQADRNGAFQIDLSDATGADTILISHLGHKPKALLKREIIDAHYDIKLSPTACQSTEQLAHIKLESLPIDVPTARDDSTSKRNYFKSSEGLQRLAIETDGIPLKLVKSAMRLTIWESDTLPVNVLILPLSAHQSVEVSDIPKSSFSTGNKQQQQSCVTVTPNKLIINPTCNVTIEWVEPGSNQHPPVKRNE